MNKQIEALKLALEAMNLARAAHGQMLLSDPPQEAWKAWRVADALMKAMKAASEALAENALDRMAENARELGLDYEPVVERVEASVGMGHGAWDMVDPKELAKAFHEALAEQPAQQQEPIRVPVTDNTYGYAKSLAEAIFKRHFASDEHYASGRVVWGVNDTVIGILTQIDNMVADMVRRPAQQQEPVAYLTEDGDRVVTAKTYNSAKKDGGSMWSTMRPFCVPSYTSPPASKPLTDAQIGAVAADIWGSVLIAPQSYQTFARAIEATLGIKGDA